jgi:RNA-directed DNA polymerase
MDIDLKRPHKEIPLTFISMKDRRDVVDILEIDKEVLNYYIHRIPENKRYVSFEISKRNGGVRKISAPIDGLKIIQKKLSDILYLSTRQSLNSHGYVKNRNILTNAKVHSNRRYVLNLDLKDFFPTINFGRVRGLFLAKPFSFTEEVATILAQICCNDNMLPQGSPTSPIVSNLICSRLDNELFGLARKSGARYTRYVDDISFSTNKFHFPQSLASVYLGEEDTTILISGQLKDSIVGNGFEINESKTRLQTNNRRQEVTGLTVNEFPNVNRRFLRQVRAMLHALEKYGLENATDHFFNKYDSKHRPEFKNEQSFLYVLKGKIEFIGMVRGKDDNTYISLRNKLSALHPEIIKGIDFKEENTAGIDVKETTLESDSDAIIFTEGKTDWKHIKAAFDGLQNIGLFKDKKITIHESDEKCGDNKLLTICQSIAKTKQQVPTIFIFDRDNDRIIKEVSETENSLKEWGNNVYSTLIPLPDYRKETPCISIEFLYKDEEIKTFDTNGRRLFFSSEFSKTSGRNVELNLTCTNKKVKSPFLQIIDDEVFDEKETNIALSKSDFSEYILNKTSPFDGFDFSSFAPLLTSIFGIKK